MSLEDLTSEDRQCIEFMLTADPEELRSWFDQTTDEFHRHCMNLLDIARMEIIDRKVERDGTPDATRLLKNILRP